MNELEALVILSRIPYMGPVKVRLLISHFGSAINALQASSHEIEELPGFGPKIGNNWNLWKKNSDWQEEFELVHRHNVQLIPFYHSDYPKRLLELHDAPLFLYVKGKIKPQDVQSIAVVGTRNATRYGLEAAEKISRDLSVMGFSVISGLARGIDTYAHMGALSQGRTLAVIGSGLLNIYPRENIALSEQIAERGALISEFSMKTTPDRQNFPRRNRIVSGMTLGTLLIEAPLDSGAMITMNKAYSQNRKLFALPGRVDIESFQGNHRLIKYGQAQLVENAMDIAEQFQDLLGNIKKQTVFTRETVALEEEEKKLWEQLPQRELSFDEIAGLAKLPAMKLNILLMSLVLKKAIKEYSGKQYKKMVL